VVTLDIGFLLDLFRNKHKEFRCEGSPEAAIVLLGESVGKFERNQKGQQLAGKLDKDRILLVRHEGLHGNFLRARFFGVFREADSHLVIDGVFRISTLSRLLVLGWLLFVTGWIFSTLTIAIFVFPESMWVLIFPAIGMLIFWLGLTCLKYAKKLADNDIEFISFTLEQILSS